LFVSSESLWLTLLGSTTRYYDAGGVRTRSIEAGVGEPVIFLHGVGGHAEAFARNVLPFGEKFDTRAIDYLGHGLTDTIDGPLTRLAMVAHLVDYMDASGIKKAHLIGESLGGWLAVWTALLHPERVGKIVFVVGAHLKVPVEQAARQKSEEGVSELRRVSKQFRDNPTPENLRARLRWLFVNPDRDISDELVALRWELYKYSKSGAQIAEILAHTPEDDFLTPDVLRRVTNPTLVLWTDHNPSVGIPEAKAAAEYLPNATFAVMTDCGHWPQWEDVTTFNELVMGFLAS
jgi:2-hydroxy-6-oxonona-2,4-dienedioate hydrolase